MSTTRLRSLFAAKRTVAVACGGIASIGTVVCFCHAAEAQCRPASFVGLGVPPGEVGSEAAGISADGSTIVGNAYASSQYTPPHAFLWTAAGGLEPLDELPGSTGSVAAGASADGSVIVGQCIFSTPSSFSRACRWTGPNAVADLGLPVGWEADAVSADGSTIVGGTSDGSSYTAFRWPATGGFSILDLSASCPSRATGVSADGAVIVGIGGFRWTQETAVECFARAPNSGSTYVEGISGNGLVAVGTATFQTQDALGNPVTRFQSLRWTSTGTVLDLGMAATPYPLAQYAAAANFDGSVVVGSTGLGVFVWTPASGVLDLTTLLRFLGNDLTGWTLTDAKGVSADGSTITGFGTHQLAPGGPTRTEAWVATVPVLLTSQPTSKITSPTCNATFSASATGSGALTYQWEIEMATNIWQHLASDPAPLPCGSGSSVYAMPNDSPNVTIGITPCPGGTGAPQHFHIRCVVSNACGSATSNEATYTVCPADFDCSGSLAVADIFAFLNAWFADDPRADFNGGGLAVQDIFDFLNAWFAGCA
jgi:uncharacterized membrane protein